MKRLYIFYSVAIILFTIGFTSCKCDDPMDPDCPNYDPCLGIDYKETNADFTIYECIRCSDAEEVDTMRFATDTLSLNNVLFEAKEDLDSYEWQFGTDPRIFTGKTVKIDFRALVGEAEVTLIGKKKPNLTCFPDDDGIDTVRKRFVRVPYEILPGKYKGYDEDKPNRVYTIHIYLDTIYSTMVIDSFPYQCIVTVEPHGMGISSGYSAFVINNRYDERYGECGFPDGKGYLQADKKTLIIDYSVVENGTRIAKKFIGQKIE